MAAFDPASHLEVTNLGTTPVDLSTRTVTNRLRAPFLKPLGVGTLAPGQSRRFTPGELGVTFGDRGEVGIFDSTVVSFKVQSRVSFDDALFYGPLPSGKAYVREKTAPYEWKVR